MHSMHVVLNVFLRLLFKSKSCKAWTVIRVWEGSLTKKQFKTSTVSLFLSLFLSLSLAFCFQNFFTLLYKFFFSFSRNNSNLSHKIFCGSSLQIADHKNVQFFTILSFFSLFSYFSIGVE